MKYLGEQINTFNQHLGGIGTEMLDLHKVAKAAVL